MTTDGMPNKKTKYDESVEKAWHKNVGRKNAQRYEELSAPGISPEKYDVRWLEERNPKL